MRFIYKTVYNVFIFYRDGFRNMTDWGKKAWIVLVIKLVIIFAIIRLFFFPDFLAKKFDNDSERSAYVRNQILNIK
jgi:hypothetical protein